MAADLTVTHLYPDLLRTYGDRGNVLTLVRISLIPVLVAVLLSALPNADFLAAVVFIVGLPL